MQVGQDVNPHILWKSINLSKVIWFHKNYIFHSSAILFRYAMGISFHPWNSCNVVVHINAQGPSGKLHINRIQIRLMIIVVEKNGMIRWMLSKFVPHLSINTQSQYFFCLLLVLSNVTIYLDSILSYIIKLFFL
jgi:hypothetical protein